MIRHIDRYIIRQFLNTAFFSLLSVTIVFVVIDAMEKLDDFIDQKATLAVIAQYYLYFIPEIIKLITPVAVLLASLFVTARMSAQNEITAMKSGGLSLYRLMLPYLVVATIVSVVSIYFNGWIVPQANKTKFTIERVYLKKDVISGSGTNIYFQDGPGRLVSMAYYDEARRTASRISIQDFSDSNRTVLRSRVDALSISWDTTAQQWILRNGIRRTFEGGQEVIERFVKQSAGRLSFRPDDLRKKQEKPDEMDYYTLKEFIDNQQRGGQDVARWLVAFYSKISFPFASVIVVLFGVPFSAVKRRGGVGVQLGISLLICFIYLIVMKVSQVFGYNGDVDPLLTAWAANIIFAGGAFAVILRVRK
jgi:lipopolysaccharide export system permease protein